MLLQSGGGGGSFKTIIELARSGVSGIIVTDIPAKLPGLGACVACVAGKSMDLPHKEGCTLASEYLEHVHIDIAGPMPVTSAGGQAYLFVVVNDYSRAVYTRPLRQKSEAADVFQVFKVVVETESGKKMHEVLTDNACELSMGKMHWNCKESGITLQHVSSTHLC